MKKNIRILKMIAHIFHEHRSKLNQELKILNMTSSEAVLLYYLYRNEGASQYEISKKMKNDKAFITRTLNKLEKNGYVKKEKSETDSRENKVYILPKAEKIKKLLYDILEKSGEFIFENLSEKEIKKLEDILNKVNIE